MFFIPSLAQSIGFAAKSDAANFQGKRFAAKSDAVNFQGKRFTGKRAAAYIRRKRFAVRLTGFTSGP